ncbi:MAG: tetratricopeptide repeat protein [Opitutaceae bacterium]
MPARPAPPARSTISAARHWSTIPACVLVFAATLFAYWPALRAGLIWDDAGHLTRTDLRGLAGLWRIWFEIGATQQYYPVTHTAFWIEHHLWGAHPAGYHLLNILLHATAAGLFAGLLRRLLNGEHDAPRAAPSATSVPLQSTVAAWVAALLFALHPVMVESVAWISEQKNTLSTVLYLVAAGAYLRFDRARRPGLYAQATGWFALALLSKTVAASLPAALLVVFWWRRGRLSWRNDIQPLLPWFALAVGAGLLTAWVEHTQIGAQGAGFDLSFAERLLLAGRATWFYLGKLLWPAELIFIYPRWRLDPAAPVQWLFPVAVVAALGGLFALRRRIRGPLAAALFFGGSLFPALGFFNVFPFVYSFVADHFQYLASLGLFAAVGVGATRLLAHAPKSLGLAVAVLVYGLLAVLTQRQARTYHDVFTLYQATLARNPACWMAHNNLALALAEAGRVAEALPHLEAALQLRPDYPEALNNLGDDLTRLGRPTEAIPPLERALALQPDYPEALHNLGLAFLANGQATEGIAALERALRARPDYPTACLNLGLALAAQGRSAEALARFEQAVRLAPGLVQARLNFGYALLLANRASEAIPQFSAASELAAADPETHRMLGRALAQAGRGTEAIAAIERALSVDARSVQAHLDLAVVLRQAGRSAEATAHFREAERLKAETGGR